MCGTWVRMRRCSSANLASGAARKRDSTVDSDAASRNPKMDGGAAASGALPPTLAGTVPNKMAEEGTTVEMSLMEASTVAQDFNRLRWTQGLVLPRCGVINFTIFIFFTKFTKADIMGA